MQCNILKRSTVCCTILVCSDLYCSAMQQTELYLMKGTAQICFHILTKVYLWISGRTGRRLGKLLLVIFLYSCTNVYFILISVIQFHSKLYPGPIVPDFLVPTQNVFWALCAPCSSHKVHSVPGPRYRLFRALITGCSSPKVQCVFGHKYRVLQSESTICAELFLQGFPVHKYSIYSIQFRALRDRCSSPQKQYFLSSKYRILQYKSIAYSWSQAQVFYSRVQCIMGPKYNMFRSTVWYGPKVQDGIVHKLYVLLFDHQLMMFQ